MRLEEEHIVVTHERSHEAVALLDEHSLDGSKLTLRHDVDPI
jgi:hypothetical protein